MSTIRTLMFAAALTAGSVACHDKAADKAAPAATADKPGPAADQPAATADKPAPVAKTAVSEADAQRFFAFAEQLIAIAVANQDDCAKLAAGINAHMEANKALIKDAAAMKQQNKELPPALKEQLAKKFKDELGPAVTKKCGKDRAVMDAFQKIKA
jgi:hypothetical protein